MRRSRFSRDRVAVSKEDREAVEAAMQGRITYLLELLGGDRLAFGSSERRTVNALFRRYAEAYIHWQDRAGDGKVGRPRKKVDIHWKPGGLIHQLDPKPPKKRPGPKKNSDWAMSVFLEMDAVIQSRKVTKSWAATVVWERRKENERSQEAYRVAYNRIQRQMTRV